MNVMLRGAGRAVTVALALASTIATVACGSSTRAPGGDDTLTKVTYRGPFVTSGGDAPFYYAQQLGYYAEEGLRVEIRDSKGSSQTIADVNSGGSDFGLASATNVMLAVAQGQRITSVATPLGKSSFGFFVPDDSGITSVAGLAGRSIAVTALVGPNMYAALSTAGISAAQIRPIIADASALPATYVSGKVDALYTSAYLAPAIARRASHLILQSEAGYNPPDYALVVRTGQLSSHRDLVLKFVRATLRGFQAAKENPGAAIDALLAQHPELARDQALGTLQATFGFLCSSAQVGKPYGQNAESDWATAAAALKQFADLKGATEGTRFLTNELFTTGGLAVGNC